MFWRKFLSAANDLRLFSKTTSVPEVHRIASEALSVAALFYLPEDIQILEGRAVDDFMKQTFRLPYDATAVLSSSFIRETKQVIQTISIGVEVVGLTNQKYKWVDPAIGSDWLVASLIFHPEREQWAPSPFIVTCDYPSDVGFRMNLLSPPGLPWEQLKHREDEILNDFKHDVSRLQNLCTMLSLHNVRKSEVAPSSSLQKSRKLRGKLPLRAYHVLEVGGDIWDGVAHGGGNDGVRSHLRRGHIRRLSDDRRVWVSAAYVHGRKDGFVDKSYSVKPTVMEECKHEQ